MFDNDKSRKTREENLAKQAENEKKNPFVLAGFGLACIISAYYLAYNQDFFGYAWIAKTIIVVFLFIATLVCFIPTVNYYFKGKVEWLFISLGVLLIPCNYMWFLLWPNMITKISAAVAFFLSIMFSTTGFLRLLYKEIQVIKVEKKGNYIKAALTIVGEILAITLSIAQIIITLR